MQIHGDPSVILALKAECMGSCFCLCMVSYLKEIPKSSFDGIAFPEFCLPSHLYAVLMDIKTLFDMAFEMLHVVLKAYKLLLRMFEQFLKVLEELVTKTEEE